jgi:hypothetical protein
MCCKEVLSSGVWRSWNCRLSCEYGKSHPAKRAFIPRKYNKQMSTWSGLCWTTSAASFAVPHTSCKMVSWMCYRLHTPVTILVQHPRAMTRTDYMTASHAAVMRLTGLWTPAHSHCARDMWYSWHAGSLHERSTCNITGAPCHVTHAGQGNLYCVHDTVLHAVTYWCMCTRGPWDLHGEGRSEIYQLVIHSRRPDNLMPDFSKELRSFL